MCVISIQFYLVYNQRTAWIKLLNFLETGDTLGRVSGNRATAVSIFTNNEISLLLDTSYFLMQNFSHRT